MECEEDLGENYEEEIEAGIDALLLDELPEIPPILVAAMSGATSYNCMRVIGHFGKRKIHILIDSGSTHNFIDLEFAKTLGCKLEAVKPMLVKTVSGKMQSSYRCRDLTFTLQGYGLTSDVRTLPLECGDLVLGV